MSGSSYSYETTEERNTAMVNSTSGISSAGGAVMLGAIALPAIMAGVAVYGAVQAGKALTRVTVSAYRKEKQREAETKLFLNDVCKRSQNFIQKKKQRTNELNARRRALAPIAAVDVPGTVPAELQSGLDTISQLHYEHDRAIDDSEFYLFSDLSRLTSLPDFDTIKGRADDLILKWKDKVNICGKNYEEALIDLKRDLTAKFATANDDLKKKLAEIDDADKKAAIRIAAESALADAEMTTALIAGRSDAVNAVEDIKLLRQNALYAEKMYASEAYAIAFSTANSIILNGMEIIFALERKAAEQRARLDSLTMRLAALTQVMSNTKVQFEFNGETRTDDLFRFASKGFRTSKRALDTIWARLTEDITIEEIKELKILVDVLECDHQSVRTLAFNRLLCYYRTEEQAERLIKALEAQDLTLAERCYEGNIPGEKLHVNFRNAQNEIFTVVIDSDIESGESRVAAHHYSSKDPKSRPDMALVKSLNSVINETLDIKMCCAQPEHFSTSNDHKLEEIKKLQTL